MMARAFQLFTDTDGGIRGTGAEHKKSQGEQGDQQAAILGIEHTEKQGDILIYLFHY
jgi:hypothetical protein